MTGKTLTGRMKDPVIKKRTFTGQFCGPFLFDEVPIKNGTVAQKYLSFCL
jgi:hypothetical protein